MRWWRSWFRRNRLDRYVEYAAQNTILTPLLVSRYRRFTLTVDGGTYAFSGGLVSANYFDTLGIRSRVRNLPVVKSRVHPPHRAAALVIVVAVGWRARHG